MRSHITKLALNADIGRGGSELGIDLVVLQRILENLPYLRYLNICAPCIYSAAHDQLTPLSVSPRLPALQKICLQNVSLSWPVLQFLRWFPRIRELQFRNLQDTTDFSTHLQRWLTAGPYVLHLRSFVFDHPGDAYAALQSLGILHAVLQDGTLRALSITALPSYLFSALDSLLHDKGSNLRHLSIAYGQEGLGSPNPSFMPIKLACSSGLTSLRLLHHINLDCGPTPVGTFQWTGMLDMIAAGELFFLQSLVVVCKVHHYRDGQLHPCTHPPSRLEHMQRGLRWLDWEKFNAVLDRLAAHCLNNVEVQLWGCGPFVHPSTFSEATTLMMGTVDSALSPRLNTITRFSTHSGH